ncbi:MAG: hypothetical protein PVSMB7_13450 [Chloroflexota bacterium]
MNDVIFLGVLADQEIVWFVAELAAVVIIVVLILRWHPGFLGGQTISQSVSRSLDKREEQIREQLSAAQRSREEAARIRQQSEQDIAAAREEAQHIVDRASTTSEAILADLQTRAREEYDRIVGQAKGQIEYERQQAEAALRRRAADIVIDAAGQIVRRDLSADTDQRIINDSLTGIGGLK